MKVCLLNHSDVSGGAARAAYRIHRALLGSGIDSTMWVSNLSSGDWTVSNPLAGWQRGAAKLSAHTVNLANRLLKTSNTSLHSLAVLPSTWPKRINTSAAEVVNMHWVNAEMLSVADISNIRKPLVWTLHDMWAFCGSEHYAEDFRWVEGYTRQNRPQLDYGLDLDRWVWKRKLACWQRPIHIVTPSHWLAGCVRKSKLMRDWPVTVIANAIDTEIWQPVDKTLARRLLNLPQDVPLVLFGAMGGGVDPRKGFDLLRQALQHLRGQMPGLQLVVFGQIAPREPEDIGFPVHYVGHLHDDLALRVLYSASDMLVIPSRQDNLPNTGVESLACGTPVLAFDTCGLPDIVSHQVTGYLAKAFDAEDLASGILWILEDRVRYARICGAARSSCIARFSNQVVAEGYRKVYSLAAATQNGH